MGNSRSHSADADGVPQLTELQLWFVSEKVMPGLQDKLGEILGLKSEEMREIRRDADLTTFTEGTLQCLIKWQEKRRDKDTVRIITGVLQDLDIFDKSMFHPARADLRTYRCKLTKSSPAPLTDNQLRFVGNRIPSEKFVPLGLHLGIPYECISTIWNKSNYSIKEASFQLLHAWQREIRGEFDETHTLAKSLEACHLLQLAQDVRKGSGLKVNHYETRKVHYVAEGLKKCIGVDEGGRLSYETEAFVMESEERSDWSRYVIELHFFSTSKTDQKQGVSPMMITFSSNHCLSVNRDGELVLMPLKSKPRDISQADGRFFMHQAAGDGGGTLMSCTNAKYICANPSEGLMTLGKKEDALIFREIQCRRR
ncbi:uncharacterized protein [Diadema antillarum]|uniref:uncharacterized protein n=1 Tax=Diadema antillarum TaxID=105358 RepID=UPI003A8C3255